MHVLVATEGQLDPDEVAEFVAPLTTNGGKATVLTVIEVPRALLQELRTQFNDVQAPELADVDTVAALSPAEPASSWPEDDAIIDQYLRGKEHEICHPVVDAFQAAGIDAESKLVEGRAAQGILETARELDVDLIIIGSHGAGLFEGLLGSTGTKVTRLAKRPVLLIHNN